MEDPCLEAAIHKLQRDYAHLNFSSQEIVTEGRRELLYQWPGSPAEDVLVCVHHGRWEQEPFHRHDFFYFNYTYQGQYDSLSSRYDRRITVREGELYAGQPFAGHALCANSGQEATVIGLLVRRDTFLRSFLPLLSSRSQLFRFFIDPATRRHSDEYIHFTVENRREVRTLLEMMVVEYANPQPDTQSVLRPLALAFLTQIALQYAAENRPAPSHETLSERVIRCMSEDIGRASLKEIAARLSYHPNYLSTVMRAELGKTYSEVLLEQRMERAAILLTGTSLSVDEIAGMLGYGSAGNFYKAFKGYYGASPREWAGEKNLG